MHFWNVWNGNCGFEEYRKHKFRFCSEYGFESLPSIKTIDEFCPRDERNLLSYTMEGHQKHLNGNVKILKYLAERYQLPKDFEGYIKAGVMKNDFTPVFELEKSVFVEALSSLDIESLSNAEFNGNNNAYFYAELYDKNNTLIARNIELGTKPKHFKFLKPSIKAEANEADGGVYLTFTADVLAKNVEVSFKNHDIILSDNYFDLSNSQPYKIFTKTTLYASELLDDISIISVYDIPLKY